VRAGQRAERLEQRSGAPIVVDAVRSRVILNGRVVVVDLARVVAVLEDGQRIAEAGALGHRLPERTQTACAMGHDRTVVLTGM